MGNEEVTIKNFNELKGQHVLINRKVLRFIAIVCDQNDYLYILWDGRDIKYHTILEPIIQLKNKIDDKQC